MNKFSVLRNKETSSLKKLKKARDRVNNRFIKKVLVEGIDIESVRGRRIGYKLNRLKLKYAEHEHDFGFPCRRCGARTYKIDCIPCRDSIKNERTCNNR